MAADYLMQYETYLREEKHASENTLCSYLRDLRQFSEQLASQRVTDLRKVKTAAINDYVANFFLVYRPFCRLDVIFAVI